jgi:hypothetical protein
MVALKALNPEAVPSAIEIAKRYRLLSEPHEAPPGCPDKYSPPRGAR